MEPTLLLAGRHGNGKSSTFNSIHQENILTLRAGSSSGGDKLQSKISEIDGKHVNVIDGLGIGDKSNPTDVELALKYSREVLERWPDGINALILVFRYGARFTNQEKETVSLIKDIFGKNIIHDYGIILMTYGDVFEIDKLEKNLSFEQWCHDQSGDFKILLDECGHRCVLFNNKTTEWFVRNNQRTILLAKVEDIQRRKGSYTLTEYEDAASGRKSLKVLGKLPLLKEMTNRVIEQINDSLSTLDIEGKPELSVHEITKLQTELDKHKHYLDNETQGTDLKLFQAEIGVLDTRLQTKLKTASTVRAILCQRGHRVNPLPGEDTSILTDNNSNGRGNGCWECLIETMIDFRSRISYLFR